MKQDGDEAGEKEEGRDEGRAVGKDEEGEKERGRD